MLNQTKVRTAFTQKRDDFHSFREEQYRQNLTIEQRLTEFLRMDANNIAQRLALLDVRFSGAIPTVEFDRAHQLCMPFESHVWHNHQHARAWAMSILQNSPVLAVDGSQIMSSLDFSLPVGAVQIGWFFNPHQAGTQYIKDVRFELISPKELQEAGEEDAPLGAIASDGDFSNWLIQQRRFVGECEQICTFMQTYKTEHPAEALTSFFDGTFVISFAGQLRQPRARPYLNAMSRLLYTSKETQCPVIGFVDNSQSHDLVKLINLVTDPISTTSTNSDTAPHLISVSDAAVAARYLPNWGDRTPFFICDRDDQLSRDNFVDFYNDVIFCYMRLASDRSPARIEFPRWTLDAGLAEAVINIIRAECIVGTGYPYAIETADALAVLTQQDRQRFYAMLQQFVEQDGMQLTMARKARSKRTRR